MALLRIARAHDRDDMPLHFEGVMLNRTVRLSGWIVGLLLAFGGITGMVSLSESWLEIPAAIAAAIGVFVLATVMRCSRFETTVGKQWLKTRIGPIKNDLARSLISEVTIRNATSWRRFYAAEEIVIKLDHGDEQPLLPSQDAEGLLNALNEI